MEKNERDAKLASLLSDERIPDDLKSCIRFHGHLCPGLIYGYLVAREAIRILELSRSQDEEIVALPESDSCAVDALQFLLGTTAGKGNLIIKDYGKNAFTILSRKKNRALRFSRKTSYRYDGEHPDEYERLEQKMVAGTAEASELKRQRFLKSLDLLHKNFGAVFTTEEVTMPEQPYATLAPSEACDLCGEMTMATRLLPGKDGKKYCIPCAEKSMK